MRSGDSTHAHFVTPVRLITLIRVFTVPVWRPVAICLTLFSRSKIWVKTHLFIRFPLLESGKRLVGRINSHAKENCAFQGARPRFLGTCFFVLAHSFFY